MRPAEPILSLAELERLRRDLLTMQQRAGRLTDWERRFMASVSLTPEGMSENQRRIVHKVADELRSGVRDQPRRKRGRGWR